jgi:outer membrane protein assembly factor BamC
MASNIKLVMLISAVLAITSCSGSNAPIRNRANDYLQSSEIPPMKAPSEAALGELYVVPDIPVSGLPLKSFNAPRPQPLSEKLFTQTVDIVSFSGKRWISINKPPAEIWPRLRSILTRSAVPTAKIDPPKGILETGWLEFKDDTEYSHRFRFVILPGVGVSSSEVRIIQMQAPLGADGSIGEWPTGSMNISREKEFTEIIANAMAADITGSSVSLLAQNIGGDSKVNVIVPKNSAPYIELKLNYARSWNSLLQSLSLGGFSVAGQDQSEGYFLTDFVEVITVSEDESILGLVNTFLDSRKEEKEPDALKYKVKVTQEKNSVEVRITDRNNKPLGQLLSIKLLKIIRGNLS